MEPRFFGRSSSAMLAQRAIEAKKERAGKEGVGVEETVLSKKRELYWKIKRWELSNVLPQMPEYLFPPNDLLLSLIELYFAEVNLFLPILHRPSFERSVAQGLHYADHWFGAVLLLVCAVGSYYSDDPRVLLDGEDDRNSSGWKWFEQVQLAGKDILAPPHLYNLQIHCLSVQFLQTTSSNAVACIMLGTAIRIAQHAGVHLKRGSNSETWTLNDELQKRAFWALFISDTNICSALGRPDSIQVEDFDLDYALEVNDDYLEQMDPEKAAKQSYKQPSYITAFNLRIKLCQLQASALRKFYYANKSKVALGSVGPEAQQRTVAELDSALNEWVDSVPEYLRWNPNQENIHYFKQSALLHTSYYHLKILVHRPFIPSPGKPSPLPFPSLEICANAARSCINTADVIRKRQLDSAPSFQLAVFVSGTVLLMSSWGGKQSSMSGDMQRVMTDVQKAMALLLVYETRWPSAGRLWDVLYDLASMRDLPLSPQYPRIANKRVRNDDSPGRSSSRKMTDTSEGSRASKHVSRAISQPDLRVRAVAPQPKLNRQQFDPHAEHWQSQIHRQPEQQFHQYQQYQYRYRHIQQQQQHQHPQFLHLSQVQTSSGSAVPGLINAAELGENQVWQQQQRTTGLWHEGAETAVGGGSLTVSSQSNPGSVPSSYSDWNIHAHMVTVGVENTRTDSLHYLSVGTNGNSTDLILQQQQQQQQHVHQTTSDNEFNAWMNAPIF
ncbi:hypothetical protein AX15_006006 [Amanita polypyramis BW_CC]|nr:hypothetical protein AX15_006006 [Amanita polypyramis BW_CC]